MPDLAPYDVLIIGYGPVGATLAALLVRHGLRIAVADEAVEIYDKPRAITLDHEVMRVFQACGLAREIAPATAPHPGTHYLGIDRSIIRIYDPQPAPHPLGWPPSITFVQPALEAALRAGVARSGRADVFLGSQAIAVADHGDRVAVTLREAGGAGGRASERVVAARYLVGCDGANSIVRRSLGIGHQDLAFDEWWMVVDVRLTRPVALPDKCIQYCWPERPATFIIGPGDLRRWEIKLLPGESPKDFAAPDNVARQLARFIDPAAIEIWRSAVYRFHALVAERWRLGRAFLAGDACHQTPPFMGQGLCAGIRDAANLAWKLALVLRAGARDALLGTYERERKPHVTALVEAAKTAGEVIGELDREKAQARDALLRGQLARGEAETIRQRYVPNLTSGLIDPSSGDAAGALLVQPRVGADGEGALLDDVVAPRFLMATLTDEAQGWLSPAARDVWRRLGGERVVIGGDGVGRMSADGIHRFPERGRLFADWMARHGAAGVVARPDRYVYGLARDPDGLNRMIERLGRHIFGSIA
ncbi:MAG TPA: bifunctional 3-(3-hydroxy-phenyl)propionate/3-hydroxycinnamic acid hydroxylase [Xanthobacteraceae bacterium]|nr:bifunctional 3-(3-hydroxy-phenyl)propionate/3-hydroxycinnamic acid hydroxylase [Xanthobacteraceae bacterium]